LVNIPDGQDLWWVLQDWEGESLHVIGCPGFNDTVLTKMLSNAPDFHRPLCPEIRRLCIKNCTNFSPRALREMYDNRRESDDMGNHIPSTLNDGYFRSFETLTILGNRPEFSRDDQEWLDGLNSSMP